MNVAVLGASAKPDRYSYKAVVMLREMGYTVYPVHPTLAVIEGIPVLATLRQVSVPLDTVTMYLSAANQVQIAEDLLACHPRRVIFNPGAENPELAARLRAAGIEAQEACTLVLLKTGQFEP